LKYPVLPFAKETLKNKLQEVLLALKTITSNTDHNANIAIQTGL
jgi:hypothetical protein